LWVSHFVQLATRAVSTLRILADAPKIAAHMLLNAGPPPLGQVQAPDMPQEQAAALAVVLDEALRDRPTVWSRGNHLDNRVAEFEARLPGHISSHIRGLVGVTLTCRADRRDRRQVAFR
jgi:hypothetical protein